MKKKWIFYSVIALFGVLFLALPLFFDIDEPGSSEAEYLEPGGGALSFNPETGEFLPAAKGSKSKQAKQPSNFFKRYAQKLGNFYTEGFNLLTASARQAPQPVYENNYDNLFYSANAADPRSYEDGSADYAHYYARQTPSGDVPVKGIHEISLTDIDKPEARKIHSNIMNRVNRAAPAAQPEPPQRAYTPGKAAAAVEERPSLLAYASITGLGSQGFIERYTGISSKQQGYDGSSGSVNGFDSSTRRASREYSEGLKPGNFEAEAKKLEADAAASAAGEDGGGVHSGIISALREALQNIFTGAQGQGQGGQDGQGHNHGGQGQGEEHKPVAFNPDLWTKQTPASCTGDSSQDEPVPAPENEKIDICKLRQGKITLPRQVPQELKEHTVLLLLGEGPVINGNKTVAVPTASDNSLPSDLVEIFIAMGFEEGKIETYPGENINDNIAFRPASEIEEIRKQSDVIEFNVDPVAAEQARFGVYMKSEKETDTIEYPEGASAAAEDAEKKWEELKDK